MKREIDIEMTFDPYALYDDDVYENQEALTNLVCRNEVDKIRFDLENKESRIRSYSNC